MFRRICIGVVAIGGLFASAYAQEPAVEARIVGLETNAEYMSLLREDARLQMREDSIVNAVERMRGRLRDEPAERQQLAQDILQLEGRIFEIRNAKGRLIDRINTIEQEWVLATLNGEGFTAARPPETSAAEIPDSLKVRCLVGNLYFREHLAPEDYAALRRAQQMETEAEACVGRYAANYRTLADLAAAYAVAETEAEATDIYQKFDSLRICNERVAAALSDQWNYIFDNKSYAYGYLLEELNRDEVLSRGEERLSDAARQLSALQEQTVSTAVADYVLRKRVILDYEQALAGILELGAAADSLRGAAAQLGETDFRLPKIEFAERYFLEYDSVAFSSTPRYTYQHPIPECRVYARGTIYRVLLGTFNTKRAAATFRGAYPLFYLVGEDGKWSYYTGGFATREEAQQAQAELKKHGFIRPEVVVWSDGEYRNLSKDGDQPAASYRVEISGTDALSDRIREVIAATAEGCELSRAGQLFVIGGIDERGTADRIAEALREADGTLEINVVQIEEKSE